MNQFVQLAVNIPFLLYNDMGIRCTVIMARQEALPYSSKYDRIGALKKTQIIEWNNNSTDHLTLKL